MKGKPRIPAEWWTIIDGLAELNGMKADPAGMAMLQAYRTVGANFGELIGEALARGIRVDDFMKWLKIMEKIDGEAAGIQYRRHKDKPHVKPS